MPNLQPREIVSYFSELGIEIGMAELLKPSQTSTQRIYEAILSVLVRPPTAIADESIQIIQTVQFMGAFLMRIGFHNFTIRDLSPESRRLIQILSSVVNFSMFRDSKRGIYEKVSAVADANYATRKRLEISRESITDEIGAIQKRLDENDRIRESLMDEVAGLENEFKAFCRHQKDKVSEASLLKAEKTEMSDKLASCKLLVYNLGQEITCFRTQIVSDPSKLVELVEEMRQLIAKEKESIKAVESSMSDRIKYYNSLVKASESLKRVRDLVAETVEVDRKIDELEHKNIILESKLKNWDSSINTIKIRINHIDRQVSHLESKIHNLQSRDKKCSEEISEKISNLRIKYDSVSDERSCMMDKIKNNNRLIQDLIYERSKMTGEYERECSDIIALLVGFSGDVEKYFAGLSGLLDE